MGNRTKRLGFSRNKGSLASSDLIVAATEFFASSTASVSFFRSGMPTMGRAFSLPYWSLGTSGTMLGIFIGDTFSTLRSEMPSAACGFVSRAHCMCDAGNGAGGGDEPVSRVSRLLVVALRPLW